MRRWLAILIGVVVGGVAGFYLGRIGPVNNLRATGQYDLMEGLALITMANAALSHGALASARVWGDEGIAYVQAATVPLRALGAVDADAVYRLLMPAEYDILSGRGTPREDRVVQIFTAELKPFANVNWGAIPEARLNAALQKIVALSPAPDPSRTP
jgi:hypothetical protein